VILSSNERGDVTSSLLLLWPGEYFYGQSLQIFCHGSKFKKYPRRFTYENLKRHEHFIFTIAMAWWRQSRVATMILSSNRRGDVTYAYSYYDRTHLLVTQRSDGHGDIIDLLLLWIWSTTHHDRGVSSMWRGPITTVISPLVSDPM
jgi:hypothetical protein